ncbi:MAG: NADH-quinone oxidoreductase subunit M [Campylobacteraceae bacterium]|nr:NADH-quinone oxidoreductase subunit M [Campylobacteraceae bacterium]
MELTIVLFFPLLAGLFGFMVDEKNIKFYGIAVSFIELCLALFVWVSFNMANTSIMMEFMPFLPRLGINYFLGVDGISLFLVVISAFMTFIALISLNVTDRLKHLIISILFLEMTMMGVFLSLDAIMFYIFWELSLLPMLYIIGVWGSGDRVYAAVKFFIYTFFGSMLMLVGIITLAYLNYKATGMISFNILNWQKLSLGFGAQIWLFLAFGIAFAIKTPLFPFHTWLPYAHGQAPTIGSVLLAAVLLKMGTYGFVRFSLPIFPDASVYMSSFICVIAVIMVVYTSFIAFAQKDIKQVIAYSSISHMGVIMLGIFSLSIEGLSGAVFFMISHALTSGGLFMMVGYLHDRTHTKEMAKFGGLAKVMPLFAFIFAILMFGGIGLPLTSGFVGEFLSLLGVFRVYPIFALLGGLSIIMGAIYSLNLYKKTFFGEVTNKENESLKDLNKTELLAIVPVALLVLYLGVFPNTILKEINDGSINTISAMYSKVQDERSVEFLKEANEARSPNVW